MSINTLENLSVEVFFMIFNYLSPADVVQSFFSLNKRLSRMITHEYLWHTHIGDSTMSLFMFNDLCQNVLKVIGSRIVSLRLTLTNIIGGWSIVSSSLKYHRITLLRHLHLVDIEPHEFNKLLRNCLMKQIHTLLVDITKSNSFNYLEVEGVYLAKVCSQLPVLRHCRLPFNHGHPLKTYPSGFPIVLPNILNTNHLRTLIIGLHTSLFLERLLLCIPSIDNLSIGIQDSWFDEDDGGIIISLPSAVDAHLLRNLSRLHIHCISNSSFHRAIALFSSVFGQLHHLSLKLKAYTLISGPLIISGDVIQKLCIDRLKPSAAYSLNLLLYAANDLEEKKVFNEFFKVPFVHRQRPRVYIQERDNSNIGRDYHCFMIYTSPCNETILPIDFFSTDLKTSHEMSVNAMDLLPFANELFISGFKKNHFSEISNCKSFMSSKVPWSLLTKITIDECTFISAANLESILRIAYNVHTLEILDDREAFPRLILRNTDNLATRIDEQIKSITMNDLTLTLQNAQRFCTLLSTRLPNLRMVSFNICASYYNWKWKPSRIVDGKIKSTKHVVNLVYYLIDHLKQLVSLHITFHDQNISETPCFPNLIQKQLYRYPPSRPYRLRCFSHMIQMWL